MGTEGTATAEVVSSSIPFGTRGARPHDFKYTWFGFRVEFLLTLVSGYKTDGYRSRVHIRIPSTQALVGESDLSTRSQTPAILIWARTATDHRVERDF